MAMDPAIYFDNTGRDDVVSGGVTLVPVDTDVGTFRAWTKRVGNNPTTKVLTLHGGPGGTHEFFECFDSFLPAAGIEYHYYDQLGSFFSDDPHDPSLLEIGHFVDEVDQVRRALGLDASNFVLLGQSWGGLLAIEYALAHPDALKALVICNMMSSVPAYNTYAAEVLMSEIDPAVLAEIKGFEEAGATEDPRYMQLLIEHHYVNHLLRAPFDQWPDPVLRGFEHLNAAVYVPMQGPSELGASGKILDWDRTADLERIEVPTLVVGARYDTMDPDFLAMMASRMPRGEYLHCPRGSHLCQYDDQATFFAGLLDFLGRLD